MSQQVNIAAYLPKMAARQPEKPALYFPTGRGSDGKVKYVHYTYKQLDDESSAIAAGLDAIGIGRGVRAVLMVRPSLEFFALTFGIFKVGAVPVMVDPGMGMSSLKKCLSRAAPEAFIGIPQAHAARVVLGWGRSTVKKLVTVGRRLMWGGHTLAQVRQKGLDAGGFEMAPTRADEIAAILFTSGSTGVPKGAVYTHGNFAAQVEALAEMFKFEPGVDIDLPTFPLFALFDPALGMTTVIPDMDATKPAKVDPRKIIEAIEDFGITTMFGSPALLNTVGRYGAAQGVKLPTLKRVMSAGAPLPASIMGRFVAMMPEDGQIFPPYGATESLPVSIMSSREILSETWAKTESGAGVCVGKPVPSIEVAIIGITDEPISTWSDGLALPQGETGEIVVKGPQVTREYWKDPENTAKAKIQDGDAVRHRMGDLGYFDDQGRLWLCGRKSHRVITTDHGTMFTVPCEAVFNAHPKVYRTALVPVEVGGKTEPILCIELEPEAKGADKAKVEAELRTLGAAVARTAPISRFAFKDALPVDIRHNAKIRREDLRDWVKGQVR